MPTTLHVRRLIEHRYGRPLEHLQHEVAHGHSPDPVLPIVLRRLAALEQTSEQSNAVHSALDASLHQAAAGRSAGDDHRLRSAVAELVDLERQEQSQTEALWDLLDVRLLLDRTDGGPTPAPHKPDLTDDAELMHIAREAAARLPRLTRDALRAALRERGIHISNRRISLVLYRLRAERTR